MKATFVELPALERHRPKYLDDAGFSELQSELMRNPEAGDVIEGTGGLRKVGLWISGAAKVSEADCE